MRFLVNLLLWLLHWLSSLVLSVLSLMMITISNWLVVVTTMLLPSTLIRCQWWRYRLGSRSIPVNSSYINSLFNYHHCSKKCTRRVFQLKVSVLLPVFWTLRKVKIINGLKAAGIWHVAFKPGSVDGIHQVVNVAAANPDFPRLLSSDSESLNTNMVMTSLPSPLLITLQSRVKLSQKVNTYQLLRPLALSSIWKQTNWSDSVWRVSRCHCSTVSPIPVLPFTRLCTHSQNCLWP